MQLLGPYQYTYIGGGHSVTRTWRLLRAQAGTAHPVCVLATVCSEMLLAQLMATLSSISTILFLGVEANFLLPIDGCVSDKQSSMGCCKHVTMPADP